MLFQGQAHQLINDTSNKNKKSFPFYSIAFTCLCQVRWDFLKRTKNQPDNENETRNQKATETSKAGDDVKRKEKNI